MTPNKACSSCSKLLLSLLLGLMAAVEAQTDPDLLVATIDRDAATIRDIPDSFMGFSLSYADVPALIGTDASDTNTLLRDFILRLDGLQGAPKIRLGGTSALQTWHNPGGQSQPSEVDYELTPELLQAIDTFLQGSNTQAVFGLNTRFPETSSTLFEDMANGILANVNASRVEAFELGNEPNLMESNGFRPSGYDFEDLIAETDHFLDRYEADVAGSVPIVGPTMNLLEATPAADADWTGRLSEYLTAYGSRLGAITQNRYPFSVDAASGSPRFFSRDNLLRFEPSFDQAAALGALASDAEAAALPFWIQEHGPAYGNVSDPWVGFIDDPALWFLHATFAYLEQGVDRVSIPLPASSPAAPLLFQRDAQTDEWLMTVQSLYYGMEAFAQVAGKGRELIELTQVSDGDAAHAWAVRDSASNLHVMIVKRANFFGYVDILVPGANQAASMIELSYDENVTFGVHWGYTGEYSNWAEPQGLGGFPRAIEVTEEGRYRFGWSGGREPQPAAAWVMIPNVGGSEAPVTAEAGPNQEFSFTQDRVLDGEASSGPINSYQWELVAGWNGVTITDPQAAQTNVTLPREGLYLFKLTVTDVDGNEDADFVTLTFEDLEAEAGLDQTGYTDETFALDGSRSSGGIVSTSWSLNDGPGDVSIAEASETQTTVTVSEMGVYQFLLTVTNSSGQSATDTVTISAGRPTVTALNTPIMERGGQVAFEAEDAQGILPGTGEWSGQVWQVGVDSNNEVLFMRGGAALGRRDREAEESPALEFPIHFRRSGTYYVWCRMRGEDRDADSLHVGFELPVTGLNGIRQNDSVDWLWTGEVPGAGQAQVVVTSPGTRVFRVWPREDGVDIDRVVLARDPNTNPDDVLNSTLLGEEPPPPGPGVNVEAEAGSDLTVQAGERFRLDALSSTGPIVEYEWTVSVSPGVTVLNRRAVLSRVIQEPGTYEIELKVSNAEGKFHFDVLTVTVLPEAATLAFATWIAQRYPGEVDPAVVGMEADPDKDGISNIAAFSFANPTKDNPTDLVDGELDGNDLMVTFARNDSAVALDPRVEISSDHEDWFQVYHALEGVTITVEDDGYGQDANGVGVDKVTVRLPVDGLERRFVRLVVNVP